MFRAEHSRTSRMRTMADIEQQSCLLLSEASDNNIVRHEDKSKPGMTEKPGCWVGKTVSGKASPNNELA